jgi:hypothetical protein
MGGYRLFGLLALAASAATTPDAAAQYVYSLIDVPGGTNTRAFKSNANGEITGDYIDSIGITKSFILTGANFELFAVPGAIYTNAWAISIQRRVVGRWDDSIGRIRGFLRDGNTFTSIEVPGATATFARGITDAGDIVGSYKDANGVTRSYLLSNGVFNFFEYPGAPTTSATAINSMGAIVGEYIDNQGITHGFLFQAGSFTQVDYPGANLTHPAGINDNGTISGRYQDSSGIEHGFTLVNGVFSTLDVPSSSYTGANGINDAGVIVGRADINGVQHGFRTITPKHVVIDDVSTNGGDALYQYDAAGLGSVPQTLYMANVSTRGLTRNAAGTNYWALNANKTVVVYDANFQPLDFWTAWGLPNNAQPEGIANFGNDLWILDKKTGKVYKYNGAALPSNEDQKPDSNFALKNTNTNPKDIVTNGSFFWVIDDAGTDKVYKYTMTGTLVSSFTLSTSGAATPTAISIDPANPNDLWIADGGTKRVYRYANAVNAANNSNQSAASSFPLASGNSNPQGLVIKP